MNIVWWLAALNTLAALASAGFGVLALTMPGLMTPRSISDSDSRFLPAMYAARAIPLGLGVAAAVWLTPISPALLILLGIAIFAQVGDVVIGATFRLPGMVCGAIFAIACHSAAMMTLMWA